MNQRHGQHSLLHNLLPHQTAPITVGNGPGIVNMCLLGAVKRICDLRDRGDIALSTSIVLGGRRQRKSGAACVHFAEQGGGVDGCGEGILARKDVVLS